MTGSPVPPPAPGALRAAFVDAALPPPDHVELGWYRDRLPADAGPVLDAACGSGRLLAPLAAVGLHVHGVDADAPSLALCTRRLEALGLTPVLFRQELAGLNLPFRYRAAILAGGAFQAIVDPVAAQAALERLRAHLAAPAHLWLDLAIPAAARHPPGGVEATVRRVRLGDGSAIAVRSEVMVDVDARRLDTRDRYERRRGDGVVEREDLASTLTWYEEDEIVALLRDAGFASASVVPSPRAAAAPGDEHRFAIEARC